MSCAMYISVAEAWRASERSVRENSAVFSVEFTTLLPWQRAYLVSFTVFFFWGGGVGLVGNGQSSARSARSTNDMLLSRMKNKWPK